MILNVALLVKAPRVLKGFPLSTIISLPSAKSVNVGLALMSAASTNTELLFSYPRTVNVEFLISIVLVFPVKVKSFDSK